MTVYVDNAFIKARVGRIDSRWCHLTADTEEELHAFAAKLGLRRDWFQDAEGPHPHYDLTTTKRESAARLGAEEIDVYDMPAKARALAVSMGNLPPSTDPNQPDPWETL